MLRTSIPLPTDAIAEFCRRRRIVRLEVFGSVLREDFGPDSDVDFLATWAEDADLSMTGLMEAEEELAKIAGRRIDLLSRRAVEQSDNWLRRKYILEDAGEIYAT